MLAAQVSRTGAPSAKPARTTAAAKTIRAAAIATQRNCNRSTPRARPKRPTSDPAATTTARTVTARATWLATSTTPLKPRKSNGPPTAWYRGSNGPPASVTTTSKTTGAATMILAHQRQRGDGSDPVGVSSRTKPSKASAVNTVAG